MTTSTREFLDGDRSPLDVVAPGEEGIVWFEFRRIDGLPGTELYVTLDRSARSDEPVDMAMFEDGFRPEHLTDEAWDPVFANLVARLGTTPRRVQRTAA